MCFAAFTYAQSNAAIERKHFSTPSFALQFLKLSRPMVYYNPPFARLKPQIAAEPKPFVFALWLGAVPIKT